MYNFEVLTNTFNGPGRTRVNFDFDVLSQPSSLYSHHLARFCSQFCAVGYELPRGKTPVEKCGGFRLFQKLDCEDIRAFGDAGRDEECYVFANRRLKIGEKEYTVVFAAFLGSQGGQWYENFDVGFDANHKGFQAAKEYCREKLTEYLKETGAKKGETKLVLTGHSRGGAVTNLIAAEIADEGIAAEREDIFAYAFASPAMTQNPDAADEKYSFIFNIINPEDFVPRCVQPEWGFRRYGVTFRLPDSDNCENYGEILDKMKACFSDYTAGREFYPFKKGEKAVNRLLSAMRKNIDSVDDYYNKLFPFEGEKMSLFYFFTCSLCRIVGEPEGTPLNKSGVQNLMKGLTANGLFRQVALFFVGYEGLHGVTKGKISNAYFSLAHDMSAYSAYMLVTEQEDLISEEITM
ncbi:MAG: DUF2974 domain-containing protein [Clostridiales bacterium]|nr:DUF2974 domain-containing protein [Clostridiales bacterium]